MSERSVSPSLLNKLDEIVPAPLEQFDAFPKLPSTYKTRSESRGFITLFVTFIAFLLVLNDFGEYIWGWPDYEFSIDPETGNTMNINVDMVVNMPCQYLSVDIRDAVGDRLYLSDGFRRDGTLFDIGQATSLKEHAEALSARQAIAQSRKSRGFFSNLFRRAIPDYKPTYNYQPAGSACRVYGTIPVKKVTANLHITTLGHGYASAQHVDHKLMNLSHVITEFSFGPYFPDITQPLDNSFEITNDPFVAYQYFIHVVPTTYIAPRSAPLHTHQYSVTHYTRVLEHHRGVPGIFFKFDMEPLSLSIHQRTTSLTKFLIRCVGVVGGVFVCMGYAVKITTHAVDAVSGADKTAGIVAAEATGVRRKWGGQELRPRVVRQGSGWVVEGGSAYGSYANSPTTGNYSNPPSPYLSPLPSGAGVGPYSPQLPNGTETPLSAHYGPGASLSPNPSNHGPGMNGNGIHVDLGGPPYQNSPRPLSSAGLGFPTAATSGSPFSPPSPGAQSLGSPPSSGLYAHFPPTPNAANGNGNGVNGGLHLSPGSAPPMSRGHTSGPPVASAKKDD